MSDENNLLFEMDGHLPPLKYSFPLALQHLVAMIVGCVTPAIIVSAVAGLDSASRILLIQSSLVCAALSTCQFCISCDNAEHCSQIWNR